jgi:hypothetical protein
MEFRWLTTEEQRTQAVESGTLSDVLALAQNLQAEGEGLVGDDQVIEMGRELGIRPEYVREALRLRRPTRPSALALSSEPAHLSSRHNPLAAVAQLFLGVFAVSILPVAMGLMIGSNASPVWMLFAFLVALMAGWTARYPRLAAVAGALAVPLVIVITGFFHATFDRNPFVRGDELILALLCCTPACSLVGRAATRVRQWLERQEDRGRLPAPGH